MLSCETQASYPIATHENAVPSKTSRLEFTIDPSVQIADGYLPKLKQPNYVNKYNRGGQPSNAVKLATTYYLEVRNYPNNYQFFVGTFINISAKRLGSRRSLCKSSKYGCTQSPHSSAPTQSWPTVYRLSTVSSRFWHLSQL